MPYFFTRFAIWLETGDNGMNFTIIAVIPFFAAIGIAFFTA